MGFFSSKWKSSFPFHLILLFSEQKIPCSVNLGEAQEGVWHPQGSAWGCGTTQEAVRKR